jgi:hypothetical protein
MTDWWAVAYPGGEPTVKHALPRPLYPADANEHGKKPSSDGPDVLAWKRSISRGQRWKPWDPDSWDDSFSNAFSHGRGTGNVGDSGVAGFQRQMGIEDSGWVGKESWDALRYALVPDGFAHSGEHLIDEEAARLFQKAFDKYGGESEPVGKLTRKAMPSPNYSSRSGAKVRLIVLHTAEGSTTIESLGNFFASTSANASSHTGIDDKLGIVGEYVKRSNKAWTAANANPVAVQTELCAFAKWTTSQWDDHPNMLENCARWIAEEAAEFDIPITKLSASQAQGSGRGVCQHNDLGSWGGGHWDCGSGFPMGDVLSRAKELA